MKVLRRPSEPAALIVQVPSIRISKHAEIAGVELLLLEPLEVRQLPRLVEKRLLGTVEAEPWEVTSTGHRRNPV
jgi:hypothetical protein